MPTASFCTLTCSNTLPRRWPRLPLRPSARVRKRRSHSSLRLVPRGEGGLQGRTHVRLRVGESVAPHDISVAGGLARLALGLLQYLSWLITRRLRLALERAALSELGPPQREGLRVFRVLLGGILVGFMGW